MYGNRINLYKQLEKMRESKVIVYITGDRSGLETQIQADILDYLTNHLDALTSPRKISLYLYTRGGSTLAAWSIVNLIRSFCEEFEVIVPSKCHSAGTLICLGANSIVMTKQATLGPIDPSVNTALNPEYPGMPSVRVPVSVEAINGFLELARDELQIKGEKNLTRVLEILSEKVHPLVLGDVYRAKSQIQMLAKKLLCQQLNDEQQIQKIIAFLCSESGSHDYTINRREAKEQLGLPIQKPDQILYNLIKQIYDDISSELRLNEVYNPYNDLNGQNPVQYSLKRALLESIDGKSNYFVSEGTLSLASNPIPLPPGIMQNMMMNDQRIFEGWR